MSDKQLAIPDSYTQKEQAQITASYIAAKFNLMNKLPIGKSLTIDQKNLVPCENDAYADAFLKVSNPGISAAEHAEIIKKTIQNLPPEFDVKRENQYLTITHRKPLFG